MKKKQFYIQLCHLRILSTETIKIILFPKAKPIQKIITYRYMALLYKIILQPSCKFQRYQVIYDCRRRTYVTLYPLVCFYCQYQQLIWRDHPSTAVWYQNHVDLCTFEESLKLPPQLDDTIRLIYRCGLQSDLTPEAKERSISNSRLIY